MATVYSSTGTCGGRTARQWRIALTYSTSTSNTAVTVSWTATIQMKSAAQYGVYLSCGGKSTTGYITSSSSSWKDVCSVSGSTSYTRTTSAQTKTLTASGSGQTVSGYSGADGSLSVSASISVPALTSYAVTYNDNTSDTVGNLPSNQTKFYGVNLSLSSAVPTRANYTFKGWATSSSGAVAYQPGASYTSNAALNLYAVWELDYQEPIVKGVKAGRCNSSGTADDYGSYARVEFSWETDAGYGAKISSATVSVNGGTAIGANITGTTSGTAWALVGGSLDSETSYSVLITVTDSAGGKGMAAGIIPAAMFPIDFRSNGRGVAFGKPADADGFEVNWDAQFNGEMRLTGPANLMDSVFMENSKNIYMENAAGTDRAVLGINSGDQLVVGYGGYSASEGSNYYYGNKIRLVSKTDIQMTSPTAGLTSRAYGVNKVLATTASYMTADQTVSLSEAVSAQPNGIILVWSYYSDGASNADFMFAFIPKHFVSAHNGAGTCCHGLCADGHMMKYLYVHDTKIVGHSSNTNTSTYGGVTRANNKYVLRYVIGV